MGVSVMNHFTVLSDDLEATRHFYCDLFGFRAVSYTHLTLPTICSV